MTNQSDREAAVLELALEDLYGLWEVVWRFRQLYPEAPDQLLQKWAADAVGRLSKQGLIDIFHMNVPAAERYPLTQKEVDELLSASGIWSPPSEQIDEYRVGATK